MPRSKKEIKNRLIAFASRNNFKPNPIRGFDWLAEVLDKNGGACPCKPKHRPVCPCKEASLEIESQGYCMCMNFLHPNYNYKSDSFSK